MDPWLEAVLVGLVQGLLEWLPVSSEGATALFLTLVGGADAGAAVQYALFLHAGTALAAVAYYRRDLAAVVATLPDLDPRTAFEPATADLAFLGVATVVSAVVGLTAYATLLAVATALAGGAFVALIGGLLVATGVVQRVAETRAVPRRDSPTPLDALLVGALQGLAILPGVSRSGTTVSALLLRGHEGEAALRLSFLLSVPAALGAGVLATLDGGVAAVDPGPAILALAMSAVVGYLTVGALVALVRRVAFWAVAVGFGALAVVGGGVLLLA
ncbi:MAG: undecaprenyl-diphosphate phosphatase [Halorientalis sp.]